MFSQVMTSTIATFPGPFKYVFNIIDVTRGVEGSKTGLNLILKDLTIEPIHAITVSLA